MMSSGEIQLLPEWCPAQSWHEQISGSLAERENLSLWC